MAEYTLRLGAPRTPITEAMIVAAAEAARTTRVPRPRRPHRHRRSLLREAVRAAWSAVAAGPEVALLVGAVAVLVGSTIGASL